MLGNAIGRDRRAIEGRTSYWFSARTRVEAGYRQNKTGTLFLPGGGTITDGFVNASYAFNTHWRAAVLHPVRAIPHSLLHERVATQHKRLGPNHLGTQPSPSSLVVSSLNLLGYSKLRTSTEIPSNSPRHQIELILA